MKTVCFLILVAGVFLSGCGQKENASRSSTASPGENPAAAPADYLGTLAKGQQTATKTLETAALNQAVQSFYVQEGRYPKSLDELVGPNYLAQLPQPPAGMKFDYNAATGQVKIVPQ
jgi:hypothetical protein